MESNNCRSTVVLTLFFCLVFNSFSHLYFTLTVCRRICLRILLFIHIFRHHIYWLTWDDMDYDKSFCNFYYILSTSYVILYLTKRNEKKPEFLKRDKMIYIEYKKKHKQTFSIASFWWKCQCKIYWQDLSESPQLFFLFIHFFLLYFRGCTISFRISFRYNKYKSV